MSLAEVAVAAHNDEEQQLWQNWLAGKSPAIRTQLFFFHSPWVRTLAGYLFNRYPHPLAEWADYLNLASIGLLQAIDGFDPLRQVKFRSYAEAYIKGAVLKGLACYIKDQRPVAQDRLASISSTDRFADTDADLELVVNVAVDLAFGYFLELGVLDPQPVDNDPLSFYSREAHDDSLSLLVEQLPATERQVIVGHYYQQLSFVALSELLGVSKSRISQLHAQALKRIRKGYEQQEGMDECW
jgi:RNA polymerase sigma factor FliA